VLVAMMPSMLTVAWLAWRAPWPISFVIADQLATARSQGLAA
jgi:hypothetical protein